MDIAPTLVALLGLPKDSLLDLVDGESLAPLFKGEIGKRKTTIPFRREQQAALIDNNYKIVMPKVGSGKYELYDLDKDPAESKDIYKDQPKIAAKLTKALDNFIASLEKSNTGADYPEGKLTTPDKGRVYWETSPEYEPYMKKLAPYTRSAKKKVRPKKKVGREK
jgi:arylsulfatase A-like enzyme